MRFIRIYKNIVYECIDCGKVAIRKRHMLRKQNLICKYCNLSGDIAKIRKGVL